MAAAQAWLIRYAQPITLLVAALLTSGAMLTVLRLPLVGWSLYAIGYVGLLLSLAGLAAFYRPSFTQVGWALLGLLYLGLLIGLPIVLILWSYYAQNIQTPDAVLAREVAQLALLKSAAWLGLLLFALWALSSGALPRAASLLLGAGALIALAAELGLLGVFSWAFGIIVLSVGLVWGAPQPEPRPGTFEQSAGTG